MADIILLIFSIGATLTMLVYVFFIAYRAWNSRPSNVKLVPVNNSIPAHTVDLASYVEIVSNQFAETLGTDKNE